MTVTMSITVANITTKLCLCDMYVTVTCDTTFCLLCLYPNKEKEKEIQNKIKENRIKLSLLFTTLIDICIDLHYHCHYY